MATPVARAFRLSRPGGALEGTVYTAAGARPAVVLCPGAAADLAPRLARAGVAVVTWGGTDCATDDVALAVTALRRGELGVTATAIGQVGGRAAVAGATRFDGDARDGAAVVRWCARALR